MGARIERFYPLFLGFLVGIATFYLAKNYSVPDSMKDVFSSIMNICGITIGFLATVKTIILAFNDQQIIKQLKKTGSYKKIFNYFSNAIQWTFLLLALSAVGLIIDFKTRLAWHPYFIGIWCFVLTVAGTSYYRAVHIFSLILRSLD